MEWAPHRPLLAAPNVTGHPSMASVPSSFDVALLLSLDSKGPKYAALLITSTLAVWSCSHFSRKHALKRKQAAHNVPRIFCNFLYICRNCMYSLFWRFCWNTHRDTDIALIMLMMCTTRYLSIYVGPPRKHSKNNLLCCRKEAARCFVSVSS